MVLSRYSANTRVAWQEKGNPKKERILLKAERQDNRLLFRNENYLVTLENGKLTGGRTGRMVATVELKRKTAPADASQPKSPSQE